MRRMILTAIAGAVVLLAAACSDPASSGSSGDDPGGASDAPVGEIRSIDDLRSVFNEDAGSIRLVLSMSPT